MTLLIFMVLWMSTVGSASSSTRSAAFQAACRSRISSTGRGCFDSEDTLFRSLLELRVALVFLCVVSRLIRLLYIRRAIGCRRVSGIRFLPLFFLFLSLLRLSLFIAVRL